MNIPCIILCRKGSKGIKNKNNIKLRGKTLFKNTLNYVRKSKLITHIVVSTDDKNIFKQAKNYCFVIYPRPKKISSDHASSEVALKHALEIFEKKFGKTKIVSYVQVTEPFRPKNILDDCIKKILYSKNYDTCFAAYEQKKNFWTYNKNKLVRISKFQERYKPRQKKRGILREDTGLALATRSKFIRLGERIGNKVTCITYSNPKFNVDINSYDDYKVAQLLSKL